MFKANSYHYSGDAHVIIISYQIFISDGRNYLFFVFKYLV